MFSFEVHFYLDEYSPAKNDDRFAPFADAISWISIVSNDLCWSVLGNYLSGVLNLLMKRWYCSILALDKFCLTWILFRPMFDRAVTLWAMPSCNKIRTFLWFPDLANFLPMGWCLPEIFTTYELLHTVHRPMQIVVKLFILKNANDHRWLWWNWGYCAKNQGEIIYIKTSYDALTGVNQIKYWKSKYDISLNGVIIGTHIIWGVLFWNSVQIIYEFIILYVIPSFHKKSLQKVLILGTLEQFVLHAKDLISGTTGDDTIWNGSNDTFWLVQCVAM